MITVQEEQEHSPIQVPIQPLRNRTIDIIETAKNLSYTLNNNVMGLTPNMAGEILTELTAIQKSIADIQLKALENRKV